MPALIQVKIPATLLRYTGEMTQSQFYLREAVLDSNVYRQLNILGVQRGVTEPPGRRFQASRAGSPCDRWSRIRYINYATGWRTIGRWLAPT